MKSKREKVIKEKRQLKIYPKYVRRAKGLIIIPEIRLCGLWLEDYGFSKNSNIIVITEKNKITILIKRNT